MISKNKSTLVVAVLSVLSTGVNAYMYPDKVVIDRLGEDVCRSGYRPLERNEAELLRDPLVENMGMWQITGLKGDWVLMGPGYRGEIKRDLPNGKTFCYPVEQPEINPDPTC